MRNEPLYKRLEKVQKVEQASPVFFWLFSLVYSVPLCFLVWYATTMHSLAWVIPYGVLIVVLAHALMVAINRMILEVKLAVVLDEDKRLRSRVEMLAFWWLLDTTEGKNTTDACDGFSQRKLYQEMALEKVTKEIEDRVRAGWEKRQDTKYGRD